MCRRVKHAPRRHKSTCRVGMRLGTDAAGFCCEADWPKYSSIEATHCNEQCKKALSSRPHPGGAR